ncbi:MAG: MBL fold metallo-hydrolase [Desulfuromonadaceae bacterium]|nr:MBL fold metallo-hydrolase [Desulfuromonadaceae bacterium]
MLIVPPFFVEHEYGGCRISCLVTGEHWKQNAYIVTDKASTNTIVIDPGDRADLIIEHISAVNGTLTHILLTHPHHDHVGAVSQLSDHYGLACELHKQDIRLLMQAPMYAMSFAKKKMGAISRFQAFEELIISHKGLNLRSLHTPGHTKGSTCYFFEESGFVFTGDTIIYQYIGRTDLPGSSLPALNDSINSLFAELPDKTVIFPGHGKPWRVKDAKEWWNQVFISPPQHNQFIHM